jgi:hypothetical protein
MNTRGPRNIHREYVEAFIVAELERPSLGVRRDALPLGSAALQLAGRRERGRGITHGQDAAATDPGKHVPMLSDDHVRLLLADCFGRDFRKRRDCATADDPELSNVELISRVARITVKGRRDRSCPIGAKTHLTLTCGTWLPRGCSP